MEIIQLFLTANRYSRPQKALEKVKKIVIHYVGNPGSTAEANRNYFESLKNQDKVFASSHYIIGLEGEVVQCIPENEVAYHAVDANTYSIGIENCHIDQSGEFNNKTYDSLVQLCKELCSKYGLNPSTDIIRHFDVTGKVCPRYYVEHQEAFEQFKKDVDGQAEKNEEREEYSMKIWRNGSTNETVYSDVDCTKEVGVIYPESSAECYAEIDSKYLIVYNIVNSNNKKTGFVKYNGGL